jgi:hypothetical protein
VWGITWAIATTLFANSAKQGKTCLSMMDLICVASPARCAARSRGLGSVPASPAAWSSHAYFVLAARPLAFAACGALRWQLGLHNYYVW